MPACSNGSRSPRWKSGVTKEELERLDHLLSAIWTAATSGDLQAQAGVLRIMDRRAKLLGLDAPQRIEDVTALSDAKLEKMAARIAARDGDSRLLEHEATSDAPKVR